MLFESSMCIVSSSLDSCVQFIGHRLGNVYMVDLNDLAMKSSTSLMAMNVRVKKTSILWHRRLGHTSLHTISKLITKDLVKGLPKLKIEFDQVCDVCQLGKQTRGSFKSKNMVSTSRPFELLHMDLFGPTRTTNLGGKKYGLMIVDNFSRYTWILFLVHKDEAFVVFLKFYKKVSNQKKFSVMAIRSDHGTEFENRFFEEFCTEHGIDHNFSARRIPQ